jgi:YEATS domain-containing protein 4
MRFVSSHYVPVQSDNIAKIVFNEPQQAFLNTLMRHPPTPLPKARRKMLPTTPESSAFLTGKGNPEFTVDMEKEETERLEEARKALISQGEEWRMKLIQLENEAEKLRREVDDL